MTYAETQMVNELRAISALEDPRASRRDRTWALRYVRKREKEAREDADYWLSMLTANQN